MPQRRSEKPPSDASTSETTAEIPPDKPSKAAWKTGEQLEYMLSQWSLFIDHQNAGTLSRFWPRIYDHWYKTWPIIPTAQSIEMWGSSKEAKVKLLTENNKVRITNSYPRTLIIHSHPLLEDPYVVSQPSSSKFQSRQIRSAT